MVNLLRSPVCFWKTFGDRLSILPPCHNCSQTQQNPALNKLSHRIQHGFFSKTLIQLGCIHVFAFKVWQPCFQNYLPQLLIIPSLKHYSFFYLSRHWNCCFRLFSITSGLKHQWSCFCPLDRTNCHNYDCGTLLQMRSVKGYWWTCLGNMKSEREVLSVALMLALWSRQVCWGDQPSVHSTLILSSFIITSRHNGACWPRCCLL